MSSGGTPARTVVSVVIPTYRRPESLVRCLEGIRGQTRPPDEVVVVPHRSDHETVQAVNAFGSVTAASQPAKLVTVDERSARAAMDAGARHARGEILVLTDDDARPHADWIDRLLASYRDSMIGAVGGRDVLHQHGSVEQGAAEVVGQVRWFGRVEGNHHIGTGGPRRVDVLKGVNLSIRRSLWAVDSRLRGVGAEPHWELELMLRIRSRDGRSFTTRARWSTTSWRHASTNGSATMFHLHTSSRQRTTKRTRSSSGRR